jgi:biotin carboxylase
LRHVLIFAKSPYPRTPYDRWLAGSGIEPIILAPAEYAQGYAHLQHVYGFDDYETNQLVEKTALRLARAHELVAVFARAETDVIRAAGLRELLRLPGQHTASALAFRDKVVMKDHLAGGPVELPVYRRLDSAYTALEFIAEHGYPVVIKPVAESGSLGTAVIRDEADLDAYLARPWPGQSEIETFVPGDMYHIDGLVANGRTVFLQPSRYINSALSFRTEDWVASLPLTSADPAYQRLIEAAHAVLRRLPTPPTTVIHLELWITPDDRLVFCEIASRTGGGIIGSMIRHAFGIDLDKEWFALECGLPARLEAHACRPAAGLSIPPSHGVLEQLPVGEEPECVLETMLGGAIGQEFHGAVKSGTFLAGYIVGADAHADLVAQLEKVATWFAERTVWRTADA